MVGYYNRLRLRNGFTNQNMTLRILGIDPGLNITGYGVLEADGGRLRLCEAGVIRGKSRGSLAKRLVEIHEGVSEVIAGLKPDVMAWKSSIRTTRGRERRF